MQTSILPFYVLGIYRYIYIYLHIFSAKGRRVKSLRRAVRVYAARSGVGRIYK